LGAGLFTVLEDRRRVVDFSRIFGREEVSISSTFYTQKDAYDLTVFLVLLGSEAISSMFYEQLLCQ
jgi:hypothetical protein